MYCSVFSKNFAFVFGTLQNILKCKILQSDIEFKNSGQRGLGFKLITICSCSEHSVNSCTMISEKSNAYETNRHVVFVFRFFFQNYSDLVDVVREASKVVYDTSILKTVQDEKKTK